MSNIFGWVLYSMTERFLGLDLVCSMELALMDPLPLMISNYKTVQHSLLPGKRYSISYAREPKYRSRSDWSLNKWCAGVIGCSNDDDGPFPYDVCYIASSSIPFLSDRRFMRGCVGEKKSDLTTMVCTLTRGAPECYSDGAIAAQHQKNSRTPTSYSQ